MNKWHLRILLVLVSSATIIEALRRKHREHSEDDLIIPHRDTPQRRRHERINHRLHHLYDTDNTDDNSPPAMRMTAHKRHRKHILQPYHREELDKVEDLHENPRHFANRRRVTAAYQLRGKSKAAIISLSARGKTKQMPRSDERLDRPNLKPERENSQRLRKGRLRSKVSISKEIEQDIFSPDLTEAEKVLAKRRREARHKNGLQIEESSELSATGKRQGKSKLSVLGKRQEKSKHSASGRRQGKAKSSAKKNGKGKSKSSKTSLKGKTGGKSAVNTSQPVDSETSSGIIKQKLESRPSKGKAKHSAKSSGKERTMKSRKTKTSSKSRQSSKTSEKDRTGGKTEASSEPKQSTKQSKVIAKLPEPLNKLQNDTTAKHESAKQIVKTVKVIKIPAQPGHSNNTSNKTAIKKFLVVAKPRQRPLRFAAAKKNPAKDPTTIYNITLIAHVTKSPDELSGSQLQREGGASTGPQTTLGKLLSDGLKGINGLTKGKNGSVGAKKIANPRSKNITTDNLLLATAKPTLQANGSTNKPPESDDIRRIFQELVATVWKRSPLQHYDLPPLNHTFNASKLAALQQINPWMDMQNSLILLESKFQLLWEFAWQNKSLADDFTDVENCEQLFANASAWLRDLQKLHHNFYSNNELLEKLKKTPEGLHFLILFTMETSLLELKGNLLVEFALLVLNVNNGQSVKPGYEFQHRYAKSVLDSDKAMCPIMETTTKMYFRSDPEEHILDTTYTALYRTIFGFVENERNFPKNEQCLSKCDEMYQTTSPTCSSVAKCSSIKNVTSVEECISENPHRVLDYATANPVTSFWGTPTGDCSSKKEINATEVEGNSCDNCMCLCDEENELADRYLSMVTSMADMDTNKVVTGVRLVKHKRVIKLQIQQGSLSPNGIILNETVAWKPLGESSIEKAYNLSYLRRRLNLDDIRQKGHFAVTGLRFRQYNVFYGLEVRFTPYNYFTGQLNDSASSWLQMSHYRNRQPINITSPDIPTRAAANKMDERKLLYVNFDVTDRDKDFSQTTIPYLDTQEVKPVKPSPLSGVGIYYKGSAGYGGFVGLKIFTTMPHPFDCSHQ